MTATTKVPLGPATANRKWYYDVNIGTEEVPVWIGVFGIKESKILKDASTEDSGDFDSDWGGDDVTGLKWGHELKLERKRQAASLTEYDDGQEFLREASDGVYAANRVQLRWYEMVPGGPQVEAYKGWVSVVWNPDGGNRAAHDTVTARLLGQSPRVSITHPATESSVPTVASITPNTEGTAGGSVAYIKGQYFTGATDVEIDTTDVEDYLVIDDYTIAVILPAMAAGTYTVHVTNANGENTTGATITYS